MEIVKTLIIGFISSLLAQILKDTIVKIAKKYYQKLKLKNLKTEVFSKDE